jgi:valyl-tRNA synthetase
LAKLRREREKVVVKLAQVNGKLGNDKFLANAKPEVVAKEQEKKAQLDATMAKILEAEERLQRSV